MATLLAFLIGIVSGARTFLALALVSWSAAFGWLDLSGSWMSWLGAQALAAILTLLAFGELYGDKQPEAKRRTIWFALIGRVIAGALAGAAIAVPAGQGWIGLGAGALGAAIGTPLTLKFRLALAKALGKDFYAALIEDALLIAASCVIIWLAT